MARQLFSNERYVTKGVKEGVDEEIQIALWNFIDLLKLEKDVELDFLQTFELRQISNNTTLNQEIVHLQEEPPCKRYYLVSTGKPIDTKIYVIDDSQQSVMMLAQEY